MRLDKWLWHARFFRTRTLSASVIKRGGVRVNGIRLTKSSMDIKVGDGITFSKGNAVRAVKVLVLSNKRGSAVEASFLYTELELSSSRHTDELNPIACRASRPDKKNRRLLTKTKRSALEP